MSTFLPSRAPKIMLQEDDSVHYAPVASDECFKLVMYDGKEYTFSKEHVEKFPKLRDPNTRYLLHIEAVIPLIFGLPCSTIPSELLDSPSEKELFLANANYLGIEISEDVILHLNTETAKQLELCAKYIASETGKKGRKKIRFCNLKHVQAWCYDLQKKFSHLYNSITPLEILRLLELGEIRDLILLDFRGKNVVGSFIKAFSKFFLSPSS